MEGIASSLLDLQKESAIAVAFLQKEGEKKKEPKKRDKTHKKGEGGRQGRSPRRHDRLSSLPKKRKEECTKPC